MAAKASVTIGLKLIELGKPIDLAEKFDDTVTPARKQHTYLVQAVADTDEVLSFGDIGTVTGLIISAVANSVDVDLDYVSTFDADMTIPQGMWAFIPTPAGIVRFKNTDSAEQVTIEMWAWGSA